ncbi:MAG: hypothetical protein ACRDPC_23915 [Solirubrobacteraceae bacterium]
MRTMIAPLGREVEAQLAALDRRRERIARRYVARLRLEPLLGVPVERGALASYGCRRVYFDRDSRPDDVFAAPGASRRGDEDPSRGPKWRIVYWIREAPQTGVRLLIILAVGEGHPDPGQPTAYELAGAQLARLTKGRFA